MIMKTSYPKRRKEIIYDVINIGILRKGRICRCFNNVQPSFVNDNDNDIEMFDTFVLSKSSFFLRTSDSRLARAY